MALHQRLFFLLLVLLPTQLGLHFWPQWAHILGRRVDYLSPTIFLTDILIGCLLLSWSLTRPGFFLKNRKATITTLGMICCTAVFVSLNIWFSESRFVAIYKWVKVLEFVGLGWYIVRTKQKLTHMALPLSIGVLYSSVIAIVQFVIQRSIGGPLWFLGERAFTITSPGVARLDVPRLLLRPYATFPHPNVLGGYLAALLPFMFFQSIKKHTVKWQKWWYSTTCVLGAIALVCTFSRSAWVAGAIGLAGIIMWYVVYGDRKKRLRFLAGLMFLVVVLFSLVVVLRPSLADESVTKRGALNMAAIAMWQPSPIVGVGLGNFLIKLPQTSLVREVNFLQPVHNIYLLILSEVGISGIVIMALSILNLVKSGAKSPSDGKKNVNIFITYNSLFIILLLGIFDHYPLTLQQGQLLLTVILSLCISRR